MSCRELNAKFLVVDNYAVSFFEKGNCFGCRERNFDRARAWK